MEHVAANAGLYDFCLFFSYRSYQTYHGARAAAARAILVPTAERDPRRGYFPRSPEATRSSWKTFGIVVVAVAIVAGCVGSGLVASIAPLLWFPVVVVVGLGVVLLAMSGALPRKTMAGAEAAARWRAFRKYLAEIERYEKLDQAKDIFDRYLPYAVAFGIDRSWVQKFAGVSAPTPTWYGGGGFGGGLGPFEGGSYPGRRYPHGGGTTIYPGGGWIGDGGGGGDRGGGGGNAEFPGLPDLQETSDRGGRTLQSSSDGLFTMLTIAGQVFSALGSSGGGRSGRSGWSGGGGFSGGGGGGGRRLRRRWRRLPLAAIKSRRPRRKTSARWNHGCFARRT